MSEKAAPLPEATRKHIKEEIFGLYEYWTHFRFVPWNNSAEHYDLGHSNYLIFVEYNTACWSYSGNNVVLKGQKISCCKYDRCIHELGHAIGFIHEISNPLRDDYIRVNYQNIMDGMEPNFEKITKEKGVRNFGYYDMSSVMGYNTWAFSKNMKDTITVLDPEIQYLVQQKDVTVFYMFYEAQQLYNMKADKCPDFSFTCDNGGYLSYVNGTCRCRCPDGLDYKTNCAELENGLTGSVIYLSDSNSRINITSPGYPDVYRGTSASFWFIKGPAKSRIALDFDHFDIPYSTSCSTYVEIRFVMPGQPGVRYCGDKFSRTIVSHEEFISITLVGSNDGSHGKFAARLRLIKDDDLCYSDSGKDASYQGKVNYARNFETCIPWDRVTNCTFNTFNFFLFLSVTWMDLEGNYCRNPGHGTEPWCYINADTCARSYCDVCHLRNCYDIFDDCKIQLENDQRFCSNDPEATRGCRASCGLCNVTEEVPAVSNVTCPSPDKTVTDGVLVSNKTVFRAGDKAIYKCNKADGTGKGERTCTAQGSWTYLGYVCDDNPTCTDQRLDCGNLLERTPTLCIQYSKFAGLKCKRTCGICSNIPKERCNVEAVIGNVTETSTGPYNVGDVVKYSCNKQYIYSSGSLTRACMINATLSGEMPGCSAIEDVVTSLNSVNLRRRKRWTKGNEVYTLSNPYHRIKRKGEIIAWQFYSLFSGRVTFHVWRQAGDTNSYKLLGSNEIAATLEDRLVTVNVSLDQRISVRPGDFIGLYVPSINPGGIVYDSCKTEFEPEGGNQLVPIGIAPWRVGQFYKMKQTSTCKLFSVSAKIGPIRTIDINLLKQEWRKFLLFHK
ncbi:uncharacterized protein LOC132734236 [Ruditapes philippinarum]|uniref:uncharacterized protein LOC132734236 n=1 Tax=Ruditapes philippinarum TaxID=129788 RepID=UPI00295A72E1|nr:uncharacterized protein LOC132734236 [Ruditapes philippinarum]